LRTCTHLCSLAFHPQWNPGLGGTGGFGGMGPGGGATTGRKGGGGGGSGTTTGRKGGGGGGATTPGAAGAVCEVAAVPAVASVVAAVPAVVSVVAAGVCDVVDSSDFLVQPDMNNTNKLNDNAVTKPSFIQRNILGIHLLSINIENSMFQLIYLFKIVNETT
jgi:hypothetical protein